MLTLVRAGDAPAAEQMPVDPAALKPEPAGLHQHAALSVPMFAAPDSYSLAGLPETKTFSTKDFRPRGHSILDSDPHLNLEDDALVHDTSVWQQLSDYRVRDRIRVLTLFQSHASELSLQAGKGGAPSLQWTSRLSNWRHDSRGLLDRLFPVTVSSESNGLHGLGHSAGISSAGKAAAAIAPLHFGPPIPP
jgi:hypothetical protein